LQNIVIPGLSIAVPCGVREPPLSCNNFSTITVLLIDRTQPEKKPPYQSPHPPASSQSEVIAEDDASPLPSRMQPERQSPRLQEGHPACQPEKHKNILVSNPKHSHQPRLPVEKMNFRIAHFQIYVNTHGFHG